MRKWHLPNNTAANVTRAGVGSYVLGFAHTDYGPEFEAQFRDVLHHRYKMPEDEAQRCGICVVNLWAPVQRPAYQNPLAVLDASTMDLSTDAVSYHLDPAFDTGYAYFKDQTGAAVHPRPLEQRVPVAAIDAPALSPLFKYVRLQTAGTAHSDIAHTLRSLSLQPIVISHHPIARSPGHRWVYLPDMSPDEAMVFKQFDFREVRLRPLRAL